MRSHFLSLQIVVTASVVSFLAACSDAAAPVKEKPPVVEVPVPSEPPAVSDLLLDEVRILGLATYDGSNEVVHPDIAVTPASWGSTPWYLVATPYPNGNAGFENPSVFQGFSWTDWRSPEGLDNPVANPAPGGYLSDPDQFYNQDTQELWMYYREVNSGNNIIWLIRSRNGSTWTPPVEVLRAPNHQVISPSIVQHGAGDFMMWAVNSGGTGCASTSTTVELRRSTNGSKWGAPTVVSLRHPRGLFAWHIDVEWIPERNEYWAVFNSKTPGSCTTGELDFATSPDGINWTVYPTPLIKRGDIADFSAIVYRASFIYQPRTDNVVFWYSGAKYNEESNSYTWKSAIQRMTRSALMTHVSAIPPTMSRRHSWQSGTPHKRPPELTNRTAP